MHLSSKAMHPAEHGLTSGVSIALALFLWGKGMRALIGSLVELER